MVLGGLWYSPVLFAKRWMRESGVTEEKARSANMGKTMGTAFVLALIGAAVFAMFLGPKPVAGAGVLARAFRRDCAGSRVLSVSTICSNSGR